MVHVGNVMDEVRVRVELADKVWGGRKAEKKVIVEFERQIQ